jgi:hypothetical protein
MSENRIFQTDRYKEIEGQIKGYINSQAAFLTTRTISSPRAVGDALQSLLEDGFKRIMGADIVEYSSDFARRAMADLAFTDKDGNYYVVDIKTHRLDTHFNMPNLTSVERLSRFYEDDKNHFVILSVAYAAEGLNVKVETVHFVPIEFLDWDCLTLGALGWGQIQIANSNHVTINERGSRKKWMLQMCDTLFTFYEKEIGKIGHRIEYFKKVKALWLSKEDHAVPRKRKAVI